MKETSNNSKNNDDKEIIDFSEVVIIGAGISGLQCAETLLQRMQQLRPNNKKQNVVILEARDRVGGRINTIKHKIMIDPPGTSSEIYVDEGAAWVHGTGSICKDAATYHQMFHHSNNDKDSAMLSHHLTEEDKDFEVEVGMLSRASSWWSAEGNNSINNPVVDLIIRGGGRLVGISPLGNPWTQPRHVLHASQLLSNITQQQNEFGLVALFIKDYTRNNNNNIIHRPTKNQINQALQLHEKTLQEMSSFGNAAYDIGEGLVTTMISVADVIHLLNTGGEELYNESNIVNDEYIIHTAKMIYQKLYSKHTNDSQYLLDKSKPNAAISEEEDWRIIQAIAKLYFFLWEIWQSASLQELPLNDCIQDDEYEYNDRSTSEPAEEGKLHRNQYLNDDVDDTTMESSDNSSSNSGDFLGPHCIVANGGMSTALTPLLSYINQVQNQDEECSIIQCNQEVISITKVDDIITITCKSGYTIQCRICIITIPLGCLQDKIIHLPPNTPFFTPNISNEKIEAIQSLKMGNYKKVFLSFKSMFWSDSVVHNEPFIALVRPKKNSDTHVVDLGEYLWLDNLWAKDGIPCLEAILVGKAAQSCYNVPTNIIRDAVLDFIQEAMILEEEVQTIIPNLCISCNVTRWEEDSFSKGAYSYAPIGSSISHFNSLQKSEWDDTLYFAGECTIYEYQGSVHSALLSGINVANRIQLDS